MSNKYCYKLGPFVWLTLMTLCVEFSIMAKFGQHIFHQPFPWYVKLIWSVIACLVLLGLAISYRNYKNRPKEEKQGEDFNPFDPPIDVEYIEKKKQK
mmetsp:Transcript_8108/g.6046  ORF Transcript_8108/g.6046 Transcript_8108/m.6046 type:complete len:97 (+) Transcript_8108:587-877(+)